MRRPDASKSALDALDHHVADHLAGDARGCGVTSIFQNVSEIGEVGHAFFCLVPEALIRNLLELVWLLTADVTAKSR